LLLVRECLNKETDKFEEEKGMEIFNNSFKPQTLFGDEM